MAMKGDKPAEGVRRVSRASAAGAKKSGTSRRVTARATFDLDEAVAAESSAPVTSSVSYAGAGISRRLGSSVREQDVTDFLRQFIMLLEAGTPLMRSLTILSTRGERAGIRNMVADIAQFVESGNALWQAFERYPNHFDPVFTNLIKASEASGTLNVVLKRLVQFRERRGMLRRRIVGAMWYPAILVVACSLVLLLIAKVVVPEFEQLFAKLGVTKLPAFTKFFMYTVTKLASWPVLVGIVSVIVVFCILYWWANRSPIWRLRIDRMKLRIPRIGKTIVRKNAIVEFTRSMSLLLRSGLSMMVTLDLVRNNIHNTAVANVMQHVRDAVERGEGIEEPLRQAKGIIPPVVADMLVTGEESGQLDQIAEHIANTYEEEVSISIGTIGELMQPVLTVIIGIIVGVLFVALFVPMIQALNSLAAQSGGGAGAS